jgi:starch synthase
MLPTSPLTDAPRSVLMIGSEALPFSKTGGLADVLGALPQAIARLGWDVTLFVPRYRGVDAGTFREELDITVGGYHTTLSLYEAPLGDGARAILVDEPGMFDREELYGVGNIDYPDNPRRFALLVRAAIEWASRQPTPPAIVHGHDWQAGLAPVYLRTLYATNPFVGTARSVFTIHNLAYQGFCEPDWLPRLDLGWRLFTIDQLEYWGRVSLLKGGIVNADAITTVSPQYAKEIQTPQGGVGFDGILRAHAGRLFGVLNGIDTSQWNPQTDPYLPQPYSAADLSGKSAAKRAVLAEYGLPIDDAALERPLIGMISRMVDQKGLDLIAALAADLPRLPAMFVVLGSGEARYQDMWRALAAAYPAQFGVRIGFDEALAHRIEGGADLFLMPSLFEPCGLNQMYSLRYGTLPIVRRVGGLADTVTDVQPDGGAGTGFVFTEYDPAVLLGTIHRALAAYGNQTRWRAIQVRGMGQDLSWDRSAREYVKIYEYALTRERA